MRNRKDQYILTTKGFKRSGSRYFLLDNIDPQTYDNILTHGVIHHVSELRKNPFDYILREFRKVYDDQLLDRINGVIFEYNEYLLWGYETTPDSHELLMEYPDHDPVRFYRTRFIRGEVAKTIGGDDVFFQYRLKETGWLYCENRTQGLFDEVYNRDGLYLGTGFDLDRKGIQDESVLLESKYRVKIKDLTMCRKKT